MSTSHVQKMKQCIINLVSVAHVLHKIIKLTTICAYEKLQ